MLYILVIFLIILIICIACMSNGKESSSSGSSTSPAKSDSKGMYYGLGFLIFFIIVIIVLFAVTWPEMEVDKTYDGKARKRVMWVNTDSLDVNNEHDRAWCNNLMMNKAPNKIGILIVKVQPNPESTEQFVQDEKMRFLRAYEKFTILFGHPPRAVKWKDGKPSKDTKDFIKEKMVKLNKKNLFRRTVRK